MCAPSTALSWHHRRAGNRTGSACFSRQVGTRNLTCHLRPLAYRSLPTSVFPVRLLDGENPICDLRLAARRSLPQEEMRPLDRYVSRHHGTIHPCRPPTAPLRTTAPPLHGALPYTHVSHCLVSRSIAATTLRTCFRQSRYRRMLPATQEPRHPNGAGISANRYRFPETRSGLGGPGMLEGLCTDQPLPAPA